VAVNYAELVKVRDALVEETSVPKAFAEFDEKRHALCEKYSRRDGLGKPQIDPQTRNYIINPLHLETCEAALEDLTKEYPGVLGEYNEMQEKNRERLDEVVEVEVERMKLDDFPDNVLTPNDMLILRPIIDAVLPVPAPVCEEKNAQAPRDSDPDWQLPVPVREGKDVQAPRDPDWQSPTPMCEEKNDG